MSVGLLFLVGCGPAVSEKGTVKGTVTYKGQPVNNAGLTLYPAAGGGTGKPAMNIPVNKEGAFHAADVPPGDYLIVVNPSKGSEGLPVAPPDKAAEAQAKLQKTDPTIPIPDKYKDQSSTTLKQTIGKGDQTLSLVLTDD